MVPNNRCCHVWVTMKTQPAKSLTATKIGSQPLDLPACAAPGLVASGHVHAGAYGRAEEPSGSSEAPSSAWHLLQQARPHQTVHWEPSQTAAQVGLPHCCAGQGFTPAHKGCRCCVLHQEPASTAVDFSVSARCATRCSQSGCAQQGGTAAYITGALPHPCRFSAAYKL